MPDEIRPMFSIICATYNRADKLPRAIDSVIQQSIQDWELIIVDDGSTDNTKEVIGEYLSDSRIKFFRIGNNRGVGVARNLGVRQTKADWVVLLDSDNALLPDSLKIILDAIVTNPQISIHKFCVRSFQNLSMGQVPKCSLVVTARQYLCGVFKGEHHTATKAPLLKKHPFVENISGGERITWCLIALDCNAVAYHPFVTEKYEVDGGDRLSSKARNYRRLMFVHRTDIALLWRSYLKLCPLHLLTRLGKFVIYYFIDRISRAYK